MGEIIAGLLTLGMLVLLQAVLGFDNLLYISLESKRVEASQQRKVRLIGIGMAIFLRIALLFIVVKAISMFEEPYSFLTFGQDNENAWFACKFNLESIVVLFGGGFILYTAVKEIFHMLSIHDLEHEGDGKPNRSFASALFWIIVMNLIFSFDSILSAMALTDNMFIMSCAIIISGVLMMVLADHVAGFLAKNRMYEVLGLFILFIVGIMLVSEGGHKAHIALFGHEVEAMSKGTFYFVLIVLIIVDVIQGRYQKKLAMEAQHAAGGH